MLHNHPNRDIRFSEGDLRTFDELQRKHPGLVPMMGVINGGEASFVTMRGKERDIAENIPLDPELIGWHPGERDPITGVREGDPLYEGVRAPYEIERFLTEDHLQMYAGMMKSFNTPHNWATVVITDNYDRIVAIAETDELVNDNLYEGLRDLTTRWGGWKTHLVVSKGDWYGSDWNAGAEYLNSKLSTNGLYNAGVASVWLDGQQTLEGASVYAKRTRFPFPSEVRNATAAQHRVNNPPPMEIVRNVEPGEVVNPQLEDAEEIGARNVPFDEEAGAPPQVGDIEDVPFRGFLGRPLIADSVLEWLNNFHDVQDIIERINGRNYNVTTEALPYFLLNRIADTFIYGSNVGLDETSRVRIAEVDFENTIRPMLQTSIDNYIDAHSSFQFNGQIPVRNYLNIIEDLDNASIAAGSATDAGGRLGQVERFIAYLDSVDGAAPEEFGEALADIDLNQPFRQGARQTTIDRLENLDNSFTAEFDIDGRGSADQRLNYWLRRNFPIPSEEIPARLANYFNRAYDDDVRSWLQTEAGLNMMERISSNLDFEATGNTFITAVFLYLQFADAIAGGKSSRKVAQALETATAYRMSFPIIRQFLERFYRLSRADEIRLGRTIGNEAQRNIYAQSTDALNEIADREMEGVSVREMLQQGVSAEEIAGHWSDIGPEDIIAIANHTDIDLPPLNQYTDMEFIEELTSRFLPDHGDVTVYMALRDGTVDIETIANQFDDVRITDVQAAAQHMANIYGTSYGLTDSDLPVPEDYPGSSEAELANILQHEADNGETVLNMLRNGMSPEGIANNTGLYTPEQIVSSSSIGINLSRCNRRWGITRALWRCSYLCRPVSKRRKTFNSFGDR